MKKICSIALALCLAFTGIALSACTPPAEATLTLTTADDARSIQPGATLQFTATPSDGVTFEITSGGTKAGISASGLLTVSGTAEVGLKIKVVAKKGTLTSNEITVTVAEIPLTGITGATSGKSTMFPGETATLSCTLAPANTTQKAISWEIVSSTAVASITGSTLKIGQTSGAGTVKVRAKYGDIVSNEAEVAVVLQSSHYYVDTDDEITIKNMSVSAEEVLVVSVTDEEGHGVDDVNVTFEVTEGQSLINLVPDGYSCRVRLLGHGTAKISIKVDGVPRFETLVNCIWTPSRIDLPEYLSGKEAKTYAVGRGQSFDFVAAVPASEPQACKDIDYIFENIDTPVVQGSEDPAMPAGEYIDGKISFNQTGRIKVKAVSMSGNTVETYAERVFTVNDGINVSTWADLKARLEDPENAQKAVNIVVTQKPAAGYGYDIVPAVALKTAPTVGDLLGQTIGEEYFGPQASIYITNSVTVNGNNHVVNLSGLKSNLSVIDVIPPVFEFVLAEDGYVHLNDLVVFGNVTVAGENTAGGANFTQDSETGKLIGVHRRAISIGGDDFNLGRYDVQMNNVEVRNFQVGIRVNGALPGSVCSGITVADCFTNGMETAYCIMELKNATFGLCGATAIEPTHEYSSQAGPDRNQPQQITFSGKLNMTNVNKGDTAYLLGYKVFGVTIPTIVSGILATMSSVQRSHVINAQGQFKFAVFLFNDPTSYNYSQVTAQGGIGILNPDSASTEILPQYELVAVPVKVQIPGIGLSNMGTAIVYNWHYSPVAASAS